MKITAMLSKRISRIGTIYNFHISPIMFYLYWIYTGSSCNEHNRSNAGKMCWHNMQTLHHTNQDRFVIGEARL